MSTRLQAQQQSRPTPAPALTPARSGLLQRKCACGGTPGVDGECAECRAKRLGVQRQPASPATPAAVPPIVHDVLRSPGHPLDAGTRAFMEPRFGHDFSRVRMHTDAKAAQSAEAVNALAYTVGREVVFGTGHYRPGTSAGQRVLAHELAHVVQQRGASPTDLAHLRIDLKPEHEIQARLAEQSQLPAERKNELLSPIAQDTGMLLLQRLVPSSSTKKVPAQGIVSFEMTEGFVSNEVSLQGKPAGHNEGVDFTLTLSPNVNPSDFAVVQLVRGSITFRDQSGNLHFIKVSLHGQSVPFNFEQDWVVDSPDAQPEFGKTHQPPVTIASVSTDWGDEPGVSPASVGGEMPVPTRFKVWFRTGIYRRPIPTTATAFEAQKPNPIAEIRWASHWRNEGSPPIIVPQPIAPS